MEQFQIIPNNWEDLTGEVSNINNLYQDETSNSEHTGSYGFDLQDQTYDYTQTLQDIGPEVDYETIVRSKNVYFDPNPQIIKRPFTGDPVVYNQNIKVRFLQPPPIEQGPLIINEVRPPQPPPLSPLIIRQRALPLPSPPPIVLRERPPPVPEILTAKVVTKSLPPIPPPPRSVIIERLPALPPKPRDIIIERWLPYESTQKRKVIVDRADPPKPYPEPRNLIITYEPVQARIVRHVERLGVSLEDPQKYSSMYGTSLLDTDQLLSHIRQLGITEDLSPPNQTSSSNYNYNSLPEQQQTYSPTYENLLSASASNNSSSNSPNEEDFNGQFTQYGLSNDSIPY